MEISTIFGTETATTTLQNTSPRKDEKQDSASFQEIMKGCAEEPDAQSSGKAEEPAKAAKEASTSNEAALTMTEKLTDAAKSVKIDSPAKEASGKTDTEAVSQQTLSGMMPAAVAPVLNYDVKTEADAPKGDGKADDIAAEEASIPQTVQAAQMLAPAQPLAPANEASIAEADQAEPTSTETPAINRVLSVIPEQTLPTENKTEANAKTSSDAPVANTEATEPSSPETVITEESGIKGNDLVAQPESVPVGNSNNLINPDINAGNIEIPKEFKIDAKETSDSEIKVKDAVKTEEPKTEKTTGFKESAKEFQASADDRIKNGDDAAKAPEVLAAVGLTDSAPDADSDDARQPEGDAKALDNGMGAKTDAAVTTPADRFSVDSAKPAKEEASVHKTEVYGKLENGIKASIAKSGKEVSLSLNPDHLGQMRIKLNIEDNLVSAKIVVDNAAVKGVLEADAGKLREVFGSQGLTLDKYTIEISQQSSFSPSDLGGGQAGMSREGAYSQNAWRNFTMNSSEDQNGMQYPQEFREGGIKKSGVDLFA